MLNCTLLLTVVLFSLTSHAKMKVIYGVDNRVDHYEVLSRKHLNLAGSTAAMIDKYDLEKGNTYTEIFGETLEDRMNLCAGEKFAHQLSASICTGFLVAEDLLITAGHCMEDQSMCDDYAWVFDYAIKSESEDVQTKSMKVKNSSVYTCKEILSQKKEGVLDFALIRLDRKVTNRSPLKLKKDENMIGTSLVVIGHPSGLPSKIAGGAIISQIFSEYFTAPLDTFGGNSGSPVFNDATGEVEGMLIMGQKDYIENKKKDCTHVNQLSQLSSDSETVVKSSVFYKIFKTFL